MTRDELLQMAHQATYLSERLAGAWLPIQGRAPQQAAQARLARWCHLAAGDDWTRLGERLAWDGLDLDGARRLLTDGSLADWTEPPAWTEVIAAAVVPAPAAHASPDLTLVVQPLLAVAQERLQQTAGAMLTWLAPVAREKLTDDLGQQLRHLAAPTLSISGLLPLAELCRAYPLLARQLATRVIQWVDSCTEFLQRLAADWPLLATQIGHHNSLAPSLIADLSPGLSDRHAGGRTVWAVTLAGERHPPTTLAYKPKDLMMDRAWNDLLDWCNAQGLTPRLGHLWTLPRTGYGWMAWALHQPTSAVDRPRYAQRAGLVLGLLHLLQATDCHAGKLVTQGDQLFLVDAEMLPYPQIGGQAQADPLDVMRSGLLPRWVVNSQEVDEIGGITKGQTLDRAQCVALGNGYASMVHFLGDHWGKLSAPQGPLAAFRQGQVRFAPRPTAAYLRLLEYLRHPAFLRHGVDFSIGADQLARTYLTRHDHKGFWPLLAAEHAALNQGDIPYFTVAIGQTAITVGAKPMADALRWPPFVVPSRLAQSQQQRLITESLDRSPYLAPALPSPQGKTGDADSFLAWAMQLGGLLLQRAVPLANGGLGWIANQRQPQSGLHQHGLVGDALYSGRAGIALFLAALYRATGDEQWRRAALAGLRGGQEDGSACHADRGGSVYALSQAAALLAAPELLTMAITLSHLRTDRAIPTWGVLDGEAGLLLGLLTLYHQLTSTNHHASAPILARAIACGDALLAGQTAWLDRTEGLGGFSHGVAGITYALATLAVRSGVARFQVGAEAGWARQQALYRDPPGNWQDRRGAAPVYLDNWCNGAAGIGLAAAASVSAMPDLTAVVERAAALLMVNNRAAGLDTLCCGRFGQIESLLEMGLILGRPDWVAQAGQFAQEAITAAAATGHFRLYDDLPSHLFNPTFFRGVAGIGYTLLRLAAATGESRAPLPCVLRWALRNEDGAIKTSAGCLADERG